MTTFGIAVALQFDDDAGVFVRFVADRGDVGKNFSFTRSAMRSTRVARFTLYGISVMTICSRLPLSSSTPALPRTFMLPRPVSRYWLTPADAADGAAGREIRALHELHQVIERDVRIVDLRADAVDDFAEIVRRNVGRHADGDAGAAVDEQIRECARENGRLGSRLVVVRDEIDRVLVHVVHERGAEMRHARFGVTHGRRRIAFDGTEIALAVDQAFRASPRAAPCGRASDKSPLRRAGDSYRWCRRRSSRTYDAAGPGKSDRSCIA